MKSTHGLPCVHHYIKSFVGHGAVLSNRGIYHIQYLAVSLVNHPLLLGALAIGERLLKIPRA